MRVLKMYSMKDKKTEMRTVMEGLSINNCHHKLQIADRKSDIWNLGLMWLAIITILSLAIILGFGFIGQAGAQVTRVGNWSSQIDGNLSYTVPAGTNRVLLVAVTGEDSNAVATVSGVTYGGQSLTFIDSAVEGAGYSNVAWMGYCDEACIGAASGTDIVVTTNVDNSYVVSAATYENVDQGTPVNDNNSFNDTNNDNANPIQTSVNNGNGDRVIYAVNFNGNYASHTPSSGFTSRVNVDAGGNSHTQAVDDRDGTTAGSPVNISTYAVGTSSRTAIVAVSLNEVSCSESTPSSITFNGTNTASGDFNGSDFVTLVDINNPEYKITETVAPVITDYHWDADNNPDINDWGGCDSRPAPPKTSTIDDGTAFSCNTDRISFAPDSTNVIWTGHYHTNYASDTAVTGRPNARVWMEERGQNDFTFRVELGYWDGSFNTFDSNGVTQFVNRNDNQVFNIDLSTISGIAPAGTAIAIRISVASFVAGSNDSRLRLGSNNGDSVSFSVEEIAETTMLDWNADPQEASGVLTDGNTYNLYARGTDPECSTVYYEGGTTSPGNAQTFTWNACVETAGVDLMALPATITGPTVITAALTGAGGSSPQVRWRNDAGAWSGWVASGSTYTPPASASGFVEFEARATGFCGGFVYDPNNGQPANTTNYDTTCSPVVSITGFNPTEGIAGTTTVDINGSGFEASQGAGFVQFNGVNVTAYTSWSNTQIVVTVPAGATTGKITVQNNTGCSGQSVTDFGVCTRNAPTLTFVPAAGNVKEGQNVVYAVTLNNNDQYCGSTNFTYALGTETLNPPANTSFVLPSSFTGGSVSVTSGGSSSIGNLTVTANSPATIGEQVTTDIDITSPNHANTSGSATSTIIPDWSDFSRLLHNSNRFGDCTDDNYDGTSQSECEGAGGTWTPTTKWGGDWGTLTGQYGGFLCETCHTKATTNIKRVKETITAPSGGFLGSNVTFLSTTSPDGFGDDNDPIGHNSSTKICEICHSITTYHRYDTSGQANLQHANNSDCVGCHPHKLGFRALGDCGQCHSLVQGPRRAVINDFVGTNPSTNIGHLAYDVASASNATLEDDCTECHREPLVNHADGSLHTPTQYTNAINSEGYCLECHDTDGSPVSGDNTPFTDGVVVANINSLWGLGSNHNKGALSNDCYSCHGDGSLGGNNKVHGGSLTKLLGDGVDVSNPATEWQAPASGDYTPVALVSADEEYKICFKCHTAYNGGPAGTLSDQGKEFNTANDSYHWVEGDKGAPKADTNYGNFNIGTSTVSDAKGTNWTLANYAYKMMPRYNGYTNAQLRQVKMRCSDCHGPNNTENNPNGPHGSTVSKILKVPNGSPFTTWDNTLAINNRGSAWCFNCHDPSFTNSGFSGADGELHVGKHEKNAAKCMSCHIKIPHGWQIPHLLKPYDMANTLPADNAKYNGTGTNSGIDLPLNSPNWNLSGSWAEDSCGSHQNCN